MWRFQTSREFMSGIYHVSIYYDSVHTARMTKKTAAVKYFGVIIEYIGAR